MILVGKQDIVRLSSISPKDREHQPRGFYSQAQSPLVNPAPPTSPIVAGKHCPERLRGSNAIKNLNVAAKVAAKAPAKTKKQKDSGNEENVPPPRLDTSPIDIIDSNSKIDDDTGGRKHWTDPEKTDFFKFVLGPDAAGDHRFEQHKKNPVHVYKRASEKVLNNKRSHKAIARLRKRSIETYAYIKAFESFTRNGGGDPDCDNPEGILKTSCYYDWEANGWLKLFSDRLGASAKVSLEVVCNSATALSDLEDNDNLDATIKAVHPTNAPQTPGPSKNAVAVVAEPKHTPASKFHLQANTSSGNMGEFMKLQMASEEKKSQVSDRKLELEHVRFELEKRKADTEEQKARLEMAQAVFAIEGADAETKDAANTYVCSLFALNK
ncbi:hypothetical protein DFH08DRAFT_959022 [Mycena albidolilacea]|uniref:No apical meristem-associated C-terminal domain-containing protein n=1 Tax=Mycena albidolilacea TaxID=1033008 RepID=A0AAD7A3F2_9AGAR|nr:hypothetical protein DFH08DRAFT_959022 [Mycena albidolilacea]